MQYYQLIALLIIDNHGNIIDNNINSITTIARTQQEEFEEFGIEK